MSFLNQLKNQARALQAERSSLDDTMVQQAAITEKAFDLLAYYVTELARQLNVIQPPGPAFTLDGKTPWPAMKLCDFRVDARRKTLRNKEVFDTVSMGWQAVPQMGRPVGGAVSVNFPPDMDRVVSRLALGPVPHERVQVRHPEKNTLQAIRFEYMTQTRGSMTATADHDRGLAHFRLMNTAGFEVVTVSYPSAAVNHDMLDELAKRIVAQPSRFV